VYVEAEKTLEQHTRYAVFVTRGVTDTNGEPLETAKAFNKAIGDDEEEDTAADPALAAYEATLRRVFAQAHFFGVKRQDIAVASVFNTLSVTAALEKIRAHLMSTPPPEPAQFREHVDEY
jgi:Bacterial virulence factor lipase N-terminal